MKARKRSVRSRVTRSSISTAELKRRYYSLTAVHAEVEAERDEFLDLYEMAPIPALTLDSGYGIRRANHAAAELLLDSPLNLVGRSFRGFVTIKDRPLFAATLARAVASGVVEKFRLSLDLPLTSTVPIHVWVRYSTLRGVFELRLLDLRDQERAEQEARRLEESERSAREASAAKDKFIAVLSHELRAPLTPVLAVASALRSRPLPDAAREAFEMIERNIAAEARLIDDLLDVNRIVRNKMQVECRNADVHLIVREAVANLVPEVEAKRHGLEIELTARHHHANVDPLRLRQVITNVMKNAIKFTPDEGHIRVVSWNNGGNVAVEVEDNGLGIDPSAMQRLFEPFMEEERTTQASGGLGLGLAISKGLIELQNGQISAHSRGPGRGARFVIELPTVAPEASPEQTLPPPSSEPPPPSSGEERPRILLVDDHEDTVEILCDLLMDYGFAVETASSVRAAQKVDLERVDVLVSDIGLPDGSGFDLMRDVRSRSNLPAIALSGFGMETDVRASQEAGFDVHLTKPIDIQRLLTAIEALSRKARRMRAGEPLSGTAHSPANPVP